MRQEQHKEKTFTLKEISHSIIKTKNENPEASSGVWRKINQELITIYGSPTHNNWFSKLEDFENAEKSELRLKAPSMFVKDWIENNFFETIQSIASKEHYTVSMGTS